MPANRPTLPPATTTTTTTALGPKSNEGWPAAGDTIIDDRWMAGDNKEGSGQEQTATINCALKAGERRPAERAAGNKKGKDKPTRRTSEEKEDDDNKEGEDCTAAAAAAATAAATAATTTGCNTSSAAIASDQAVAAVATARSSGLRQGVVAAAADNRMPSLTPVFSCLLSECSLHVAQNTMFHGSFPPDPGRIPDSGFRIPDSGGFRIPEDSRFRRIPDKLVLPWNDLIPTCLPRNPK